MIFSVFLFPFLFICLTRAAVGVMKLIWAESLDIHKQLFLLSFNALFRLLVRYRANIQLKEKHNVHKRKVLVLKYY